MSIHYETHTLPVVSAQQGACRVLIFSLRVDRDRDFARRAIIAYDAANERIATEEEIDTSSGRDFYYELFLYQEVSNTNPA